MEVRLAERAKIILLVADGDSDSQISEKVRVTSKTARKWRQRYSGRRQEKPDNSVKQWLADASRPGRPDRFDELFWVAVLKIATSEPAKYNRPITHFTTVSRFLAKCALKPHRTEQWMNRKDDPEFEARAVDVKDCLVASITEPSLERVTVSFDEKTGMQAKERVAPDQPIIFHFTPKHASWLNPIEIWFGVLVKKVLRRGSFSSTTDLEARVLRFIDYYNQKLAHPYTFKRWKKAA